MLKFIKYSALGAIVLSSMVFAQEQIPCPNYWKVQANPSVENSLTYTHDSGDLAVNVTYIKNDDSTSTFLPESYARVASEQLKCDVPDKSDLIANAWSFNCDAENVQVVVYGNDDEIVLLSIAGRNQNTQKDLVQFIRFLESQADK